MLAAVGHRQPADEVGQPDVGGGLQLRVLVQVVVELPRLVADPEVVRVVADDVVEDHEVREQDLVHPPQRLEAVEVVLRRLAFDVVRLVREQRAGRVDPLSARLEHAEVTGCCASQSISRSGCSLRSSSAIAMSRFAWPSPIGDEMNSARLRRDRPRAQRPAGARRRDEVTQEQVDLHRVAGMRRVAGSVEADERASRQLREGGARRRASGSRPRGRGSPARGSGRARRAPARSPRRTRARACVAISVSGVV